LQLLNGRRDLAPDSCTLFVAFASENHRPRSSVKLSVFAVSVDHQFGGPVDVDEVSHSGNSDAAHPVFPPKTQSGFPTYDKAGIDWRKLVKEVKAEYRRPHAEAVKLAPGRGATAE
jgi:hypothetical protein